MIRLKVTSGKARARTMIENNMPYLINYDFYLRLFHNTLEREPPCRCL